MGTMRTESLSEGDQDTQGKARLGGILGCPGHPGWASLAWGVSSSLSVEKTQVTLLCLSCQTAHTKHCSVLCPKDERTDKKPRRVLECGSGQAFIILPSPM